VRYDSPRKFQRIGHCKFPRVTVLSTTGIHKLVNRVRSTGSLLDKIPIKKGLVVTEEKFDEVGGVARIFTGKVTETYCKRDWHFKISSSKSDEIA
jgi:hypothetical protein